MFGMKNDWLRQLPAEVQTPAYIFDQAALAERAAFLKKHLPAGVSICYAVKANPFLVKEMASLTERLEVCSPGEEEICRRMGVEAEKLVISGVYKTPDVMERMVREDALSAEGKASCGRIYTIESAGQASLLAGLAKKYHTVLPVLVRLTSGNQFGMDEEDVFRLWKEKPEGLAFLGLQFFSGTQKTSLKKVKREFDSLAAFLLRLNDAGEEVKELEIGTGFPVSYFEGGELDEEPYLADFSELLCGLSFPGRITLEIGRSLAACCGTYLTTVVDTKTNRKENYAILDGGIHQLVYYGQMMAMKMPHLQVLPERSGEEEEKLWNLCGSLCTVNDVLVKQLPVRGLKVGDCIAFGDAGAYSMTEGIALFLTRDLPAVWMRQADGAFRCLRNRGETVDLNCPKEGGVPVQPVENQ